MLQKIIVTAFLCFLFLGNNAKGQAAITPTWEWQVTDNSVEVRDWVMFDNHFYTIGATGLTKWDTNGNKLFTNALVKGHQILFDNNHHAFVLSMMTADSLVFPSTTLHKQGSSDILVYSIDTSGNINWVKNLGDTSADKSNQFCIDYANNLYLTGYCNQVNGIHKFDSIGNFLWSKAIIDTFYNLYPQRLIAYSAIDSTLVVSSQFRLNAVVGLTTLNTTAGWGNSTGTDVYLLKMNLIGNPIFLKDISYTNTWSDGVSELQIDKQTGSIFTLQIKNGLSSYTQYITKYSSGGNGLSTVHWGGLNYSTNSAHLSGVSLNDSICGFINKQSTTTPYYFTIKSAQTNNLVRLYNIDSIITTTFLMSKNLFNNSTVYFHIGHTFYKLGETPMSTAYLNDTTVCANTPFTSNCAVVSGVPPYTYAWQPTSGISNPSVLNPTFTISAPITYTLTVTDGNGVSIQDSVHFTLKPVPIITAFASKTSVCKNDTVTISSSGANTLTWNWGVLNNIAFAPTVTRNYVVTGIDTNGCSGTSSVIITVRPSYNNHDTVDVCYASNYTFPDGIILTNILADTSHTSTLTTTLNCDSIITTHLIIKPTYNLIDSVDLCYASNYTFPDGIILTNILADTSHTSILPSTLNCDSIITTHLIIKPTYNLIDSVDVCYASNYTFPDGLILTNILTDTSHTSTLTTTLNCDSIITTHLYVNAIYNSADTILLCSGDDYLFPDSVLFTNILNDTSHQNHLISNMGCDSTITRYLLIQTIDTSVTYNGNLLSANAIGVAYQWYDCLNQIYLSNDTIQDFYITQGGSYCVIIKNNSNCIDTSSCYSVNPVYTVDYINANENELIIYPNPTNNKVFIKTKSKAKRTLYNSLGQLIFSTNSNEMDVSTFSRGVYYIRCEGESKKVIIE